MKSNNVFFEQQGRLMYGNRFGYAMEYSLVRDEKNVAYITFKQQLLMPDDPENWENPLPTDLASELLSALAKKEDLIVGLYGKWVVFGKDESFYDVREKIRTIQYSFIKIAPEIPKDIKVYLKKQIFNVIKELPVY